MHPFKKGQHILARCVTKGRRGPLEYSNAKKCPTESRRIPSSATRTRSSRRNRYVFFFLVLRRIRACLTTKCILFTHSAHTKKLLSVGVLLRESFSTAPSDSAFSHKEEKKEKKFSPFFLCKKSQEDAFLIHQNSSEVLTCVLYNYSLPF